MKENIVKSRTREISKREREMIEAYVKDYAFGGNQLFDIFCLKLHPYRRISLSIYT